MMKFLHSRSHNGSKELEKGESHGNNSMSLNRPLDRKNQKLSVGIISSDPAHQVLLDFGDTKS